MGFEKPMATAVSFGRELAPRFFVRPELLDETNAPDSFTQHRCSAEGPPNLPPGSAAVPLSLAPFFLFFGYFSLFFFLGSGAPDPKTQMITPQRKWGRFHLQVSLVGFPVAVNTGLSVISL